MLVLDVVAPMRFSEDNDPGDDDVHDPLDVLV
jgi:hypothetical protein